MKTSICAYLLSLSCLSATALTTTEWKAPTATYEDMKMFKVNSVDFSDTATILHLNVKYDPKFWFRISDKSYLRDDKGRKYSITGSKGVKKGETDVKLNSHIYLKSRDIANVEGVADIALHFQAMKEIPTSFAFEEGEAPGDFRILDIRDKRRTDPRLGALTETLWRNEKGDLSICFYPEAAVYDCKFWEYASVSQKGDKYDMELRNGGQTLKVAVAKENRGTRQFQIGTTKKQALSIVNTQGLPDYPTKDDTPYRDYGLRMGDSATVVGWMVNRPELIAKNCKSFTVGWTDILQEMNQDQQKVAVDSLGRFTFKVPVRGYQELFFRYADNSEGNWMDFIAEQGETYFILIDFRDQRSMVMGKNCRVQNEVMAQKFDRRVNNTCGRRESKLSDEEARKLKDDCAAILDSRLATLDSTMAAHPTLSHKFADYNRASLVFDFGRIVLVSGWFTESGRMPKDIIEYVAKQTREYENIPLSLCGDLGSLLYYYESNVIDGDEEVQKQRLTASVIDSLHRSGAFTLNDKEKGILDTWVKNAEQIEGAPKSETEKSFPGFTEGLEKLLDRDDIEKAIQKAIDWVRAEVISTDKYYATQQMRDIMKTRILCRNIEGGKAPLDQTRESLVGLIKSPECRAAIKVQNEYYKRLAESDFKHPQSVRPNTDVEGLTDGEAILSKILEPYKGKLVLIDIWGTWCGGCISKESPIPTPIHFCLSV